MLGSAIGRLRVFSVLEGVLLVLLVLVAMPLKYLADVPDPVHTLGVVHGVFYVGFLLALGQVVIDHQWSYGRTAEALVLSLLPFGAFVLERRLVRQAGG